MKIGNKNRQSLIMVIILGTLIGCVSFLMIYGVKVLDFTYDRWLYEGGDLSQHYIGWKYYRNTSWQWHIGIIKNLSDIDTCIIYTDSIPLFAIFFKLFNNVLPSTFQYFGLWGIVSYCLMGAISADMIYKLSHNKFASIIGCVFFVMSPYVLQRMFAHTSLAGQWILVLALSYYMTGKSDTVKRKITNWTIVLLIGSLIHIYFIPMIVAFIFFDVVRSVSREKKYYVFVFIVPVILTLIELTVLGAFSTMGDAEADGLGYFSANLNALINPIFSTSTFMKELGHGSGQYEGYGYLGIGIIVLIILDFFILFVNNKWKAYISKSNICLIVIAFVFFFIALSPIVMAANNILLKIPYPPIVLTILNIFRSSGRFIWVVCYIIFCCSIVLIVREIGNDVKVITVLLVCLILQIVDVLPTVKEKHDKFVSVEKKNVSNNVSNEAWDLLLQEVDKVIFIPYDMVYDNTDKTYLIEYMASDNISFNSFVVCRPDRDVMLSKQQEYIVELNKKQAREDCIYVFENIDDILDEDYGLVYYCIDGCIVGVKDNITGLEKYLLISEQSDEKGYSIDIADMGTYYFDDTDSLFTIGENGFMYGPYYSLKYGTYIVDVEGKGIDQIGWSIESYERECTFYCEVLEQNSTHCKMKIVIDKNDVNDVEIKAYNIGSSDVKISSMYIKKINE